MELRPEALAEEEGEAAGVAHAEAVGLVEGVGCGDEGDGFLLEDAEGKGDDGLSGLEMGRLAVGVGFDADVAAAPVDALDEGVEEDVATGLGELLGEELREAIVAGADAEDAVAFDGFFGCLLEGEGGYADDAVVGGVEAFDVADGGLALVFGEGVLGEIVGEGEIGLASSFRVFRGLRWPLGFRRGPEAGLLRRRGESRRARRFRGRLLR